MPNGDIKDPMVDVVETIAEEWQHSNLTPGASNKSLPVCTREILSVDSYVLYTAGSQVDDTSKALRPQAYVLCQGTPTPSSAVTNGYIRFVPDAEMRPPSYSPARKQINLWVRESALAMTLRQLELPRRYLWVGYFNNGHIYGDLHASQ